MKTILLDENIPRPLMRLLNRMSPRCYEATTVQHMGWSSIKNGKLLDAAERSFDILLTADKGIQHQQNMTGRKIAMVIIRPKWNKMKFVVPMLDKILQAVEKIQPGEVLIVDRDQP